MNQINNLLSAVRSSAASHWTKAPARTVQVIVSVFLLGLGACGPDSGTEEPRSDLVVSSDAGLAARAAALLPTLAIQTGLELTRPVRLERRTREELERYLIFKLDEELPAETAEWTEAVYQLLGLLEPEDDLRAILEDVYLEQVAGFYDPDSTTLFVLDDQPDELLETLLVHELVHAIQDQAVDLAALTDRVAGNDRQGAAQAAIEGHATLIMFEYILGQSQGEDVDIRDFPDFTATLQPSLEAARERSPALARAPRIVQEALLFPYIGGTAFVEAMWRNSGGRALPFGPNLPTSTEQVMHPDRYPQERDEPTALRLAFEGGEPVFEDGLGEMEMAVLIETLLGNGREGLSVGWDGDRYALFGDAASGYSLVWVSVWDDEAARDAFVSALAGAAVSLPGGGSLVPLEVEGRAGAVLEVGDVPFSALRVEVLQAG